MTRFAWSIWIDRGGTFTDCIGRGPDGALRVAKVLSGDGAELAGIRALLGLDDDATIPPCDVRMGTTIATNALLERRGAPTALAITRGFADLCAIGDQTRPDLFALDIVKPAPLCDEVVELDERAAPDGRVLARSDDATIAATLATVRARSLAVVVLHGHRAPALETRIADLARAAGFAHVTCSSEVSSEPGLLARAETAVVDAYLTPLLADHVARLRAALPGSRLRMMTSAGGLVDAARFRGRDAVLSGPAGGVVASAAIAAGAPAIGFDMGGTSTDVSLIDHGIHRVYQSEIGGVRVRAPAIAIHTVAAGGGSICRRDGLRMTVGPDSAGARPGPLCYGDPDAHEPTLSDVDLVLGRLAGDRFPFPLDLARARAALPIDVAAGYFAIGNAQMAEAIRRVTIARGQDPRHFALVVFGGAGGMHACAIARELGIARLLVHPLAGVQSALGMGLAPLTWHGELDGRARDVADAATLATALDALAAQGRAALLAEDDADHADDAHATLDVHRRLDLRYRGSDATITVPYDDPAARFVDEHRARFGYDRAGETIEIVAARVELVLRDDAPPLPAIAARPMPRPLRRASMWTGASMEEVPVYAREQLGPGAELAGPALILDDTTTIALDPGWTATIASDGTLSAIDHGAPATETHAPDTSAAPAPAALDHAIKLEVYGNLYMSIAEQMGDVLRRTAVSTNIRERLDFSCALFDAQGNLVANAPHIPVHLGAMGETIRALLDAVPAPPPGTVYASNDPSAGGSHLPDITVVTPVHDAAGAIRFFTASRGHHADVGGLTPGSMPPFSTSLADEGAVLRHLPIVVDGRLERDAILAAFAGGGARRPLDNLADLEAQIAAGHVGARLFEQAIAARGDDVLAYLAHVQDHAAALVERAIANLPPSEHHVDDALDDGTRVAVTVKVQVTRHAGTTRARLDVDFTGTGGEHAGNLNAPRAVTVAAVLYAMRALVAAPVPLNAGCLRPVRLHVPPRSLLDPSPGRAVCGGNVETSQRVVDVLLAALGLAAASQGTMNNLTLGDDTLAYYETIAGGAGATPRAPGADAVHTHMTNTRITDPEILEARFPVRLRRFAIRRGSGGSGRHRGGDGVIRELELLAPLEVAIVSQRRTHAPFGMDGGGEGARGRNTLDGVDLGGAAAAHAPAGAVLLIETPGGGAWGERDPTS